MSVWTFLTALVIAASGAFATWTFGWRDGEARDLEADRARAAVFAAAGEEDCREQSSSRACQVTELRHHGGSIWTFRYGAECAMVDVDDFKIRAERWHGIAPIACAARDEG